jgi:hypothetical protein
LQKDKQWKIFNEPHNVTHKIWRRKIT